MEKCYKKIPCCGCANMETCEKERINNLWSMKDIVKENKDGDFLAICDDGKEYQCSYFAKSISMFSSIPINVNVLGYLKIIERI